MQGSTDRNRLFYQNLTATAPLQGLVRGGYLDAYAVYEAVAFHFRHNASVYRGLAGADDTLAILRANAYDVEKGKAGVGRRPDGSAADALYAVAGRTLAFRVVAALDAAARAAGAGRKLVVMFGALRPLLAFLSVAGLLTRDNLADGPLAALPGHGAALVFELVSRPGAAAMPAPEDLAVRFYYRPAADADAAFGAHALFGDAAPATPLASFVERARARAASPADWCRVCQPSSPPPFCAAAAAADRAAATGTSAAVGGVIGGAATLAVLGLALLALVALGAVRLAPVRRAPAPRAAAAAGFKGADRKPADADVSVSKAGAREERVGSWELRHGGVTPDDSDAVSLGAPPVQVREGV